jgi:hypothetical protein
MNESDLNPETDKPLVSPDGEYQDPHYHDDEDDVDLNDDGTVRHNVPKKKKPNRRPPPRRWYIDD